MTRMFISLDDVKHVRATCDTCRGAAVFELDSDVSLPRQCPYCTTQWAGSSEQITWSQLISMMRLLRRSPNSGVGIQFEIEDD